MLAPGLSTDGVMLPPAAAAMRVLVPAVAFLIVQWARHDMKKMEEKLGREVSACCWLGVRTQGSKAAGVGPREAGDGSMWAVTG